MTIENLSKVIPRPVEPTYAFDDPWDSIEGGLRTPLPFDYKELMRLYGAGRFMGFFDVCGPRSPTLEGKITNIMNVARSTFIEAVQGSLFYDDPPLPIWPRRGGLMAFGQTANGDYLFWLTRGLVNEWPIVIWDRTDHLLEHFECDLTDFLAGVANATIRSPIFAGTRRHAEGQPGFTAASRPWPGPSSE